MSEPDRELDRLIAELRESRDRHAVAHQAYRRAVYEILQTDRDMNSAQRAVAEYINQLTKQVN